MESSMFRIINRNRGYFLILLISMILAFVKICQINNRSKAEAEIGALELKEEMEKRLLEIKKLEIEKLDLKIWSLEVRTQVHNIRIMLLARTPLETYRSEQMRRELDKLAEIVREMASIYRDPLEFPCASELGGLWDDTQILIAWQEGKQSHNWETDVWEEVSEEEIIPGFVRGLDSVLFWMDKMPECINHLGHPYSLPYPYPNP